jgi:hypothetical protein
LYIVFFSINTNQTQTSAITNATYRFAFLIFNF